MSSILNENHFGFAGAAKIVPSLKGGKPVAPQTINRWATRGIRGIRLEYVKCGGTAITSKEALERFFVKLTQADQCNTPTPPP